MRSELSPRVGGTTRLIEVTEGIGMDGDELLFDPNINHPDNVSVLGSSEAAPTARVEVPGQRLAPLGKAVEVELVGSVAIPA